MLFFNYFQSYLSKQSILLLQRKYVFYLIQYPLTMLLSPVCVTYFCVKAYITHFQVLIELLLLILREREGNHELGLPYLLATQWAAVITHCAEMMVPPQMCFCLRFRDTWIAKSLSEQVNALPPKPGDRTCSEKETQISYSQILEIVDCKGIKPIPRQLRKKSNVGTRTFPTLVGRSS